MNKQLIPLGLLLAVLHHTGTADTERCPTIDCDCAAINSEQWQTICYQHEATIRNECVENQGVPRSYCRMQGPDAAPTPLSVKPLSAAGNNDSASSPDVVKALISAQYWSLDEDITLIREHEANRAPLEALKVSKVLDRNIERLFQLQTVYFNQVIERFYPAEASALTSTGFGRLYQLPAKQQARAESEVQKHFKPSLEKSSELANRIIDFSRRNQSKQDPLTYSRLTENEKQLQRTAATLYEQIGYIHSWSGNNREAALAWQKAASISEHLALLEERVGSNQRFVSFYREQASARWHKATFFWLKDKDNAQAVNANQSANDALLSLPQKVMAEAEESGSRPSEGSPRSAIKR